MTSPLAPLLLMASKGATWVTLGNPDLEHHKYVKNKVMLLSKYFNMCVFKTVVFSLEKIKLDKYKCFFLFNKVQMIVNF